MADGGHGGGPEIPAFIPGPILGPEHAPPAEKPPGLFTPLSREMFGGKSESQLVSALQQEAKGIPLTPEQDMDNLKKAMQVLEWMEKQSAKADAMDAPQGAQPGEPAGSTQESPRLSTGHNVLSEEFRHDDPHGFKLTRDTNQPVTTRKEVTPDVTVSTDSTKQITTEELQEMQKQMLRNKGESWWTKIRNALSGRNQSLYQPGEKAKRPSSH